MDKALSSVMLLKGVQENYSEHSHLTTMAALEVVLLEISVAEERERGELLLCLCPAFRHLIGHSKEKKLDYMSSWSGPAGLLSHEAHNTWPDGQGTT